jgi:hypothetical protein
MANQDLTHAMFWNRMDRAVRHVGKLPEWVKGSPINERSSTLVRTLPQESADSLSDVSPSPASADSTSTRR